MKFPQLKNGLPLQGPIQQLLLFIYQRRNREFLSHTLLTGKPLDN